MTISCIINISFGRSRAVNFILSSFRIQWAIKIERSLQRASAQSEHTLSINQTNILFSQQHVENILLWLSRGRKQRKYCLSMHKWFPYILKCYLASSLILRSPFRVSHEGNLRETEWNSYIARGPFPCNSLTLEVRVPHATNNPSDRCNRLPRPRRWREPLITGNVTRSTRGSDTRRRRHERRCIRDRMLAWKISSYHDYHERSALRRETSTVKSLSPAEHVPDGSHLSEQGR